jgi:hypothetical protein
MSTALTHGPASAEFETDTEPDVRHRPTGRGGLTVRREDIVFSTVRPGVLGIEITVHNTGSRRSEPTVGALRSAPLGAFVPWRPLDLVRIPAIPAGGSSAIRREVRCTPPAALGGADKVPPDRLLTALGLIEPEPPHRDNRPADDLMALVGQGGVHWAGNLNLFLGRVDVERHLAQALRVYPGRVNMAMFIVGTLGAKDAYRFRLSGDGCDWGARLFDGMSSRPIAASVGEGPDLADGEWHVPVSSVVLLALQPPAAAETGAVNVHVEQRSTRREAVVEFTLDSRAAGPGCYVV